MRYDARRCRFKQKSSVFFCTKIKHYEYSPIPNFLVIRHKGGLNFLGNSKLGGGGYNKSGEAGKVE